MKTADLLLNCFPVELSPTAFELPFVDYESWQASTERLSEGYAKFSAHRYEFKSRQIRVVLLDGPEVPDHLPLTLLDVREHPYLGTKLMNWLRVLGTAELPHIDQGVRQQFHAKMPLLNVFKTKNHALEFILPRKRPIDMGSQDMDCFVEQAFSSPLRLLSITRILFDIGDHARIENALAIVLGIKSRVEIQIGSSKVQTGRFSDPL